MFTIAMVRKEPAMLDKSTLFTKVGDFLYKMLLSLEKDLDILR